MENMGKGKHFELTTMWSRGNSQVPWNALFSKPINQCNPGIMFRRFPLSLKMGGRWLCERLRDSIDVSHDAFTAVLPLFQQ